MHSYGLIIRIRIKKHRVQGSCFRSNISETVRDIRVSFSLWPTGSVTLPNGATHVSVVVIVSEILLSPTSRISRFSILTSNLLEQNHISRTTSYGLIRIKKYRVHGSCFRSNISETVRDIRVSFLLWPTRRVTPPNGATHVSVVVIVSEILKSPTSRISRFSILTSNLLEQNHISRTTSYGLIRIRIKKHRVQGFASGRISPKW